MFQLPESFPESEKYDEVSLFGCDNLSCNPKKLTYFFAGRRAAQCFSIRAKKSDIVEMDIVGRSGKMERQRERIT